MSKPLSRRMMLRGAGSIALGLPFLGSLVSRAEAQAASPRFLLFWQVNGTDYNRFWPNSYGRLTDASFDGRGVEALRPFRDKLLIPRGFDIRRCGRDGHAGTTATTALRTANNTEFPRGPSVDQVISDGINPPNRGPLNLTVRRVRQPLDKPMHFVSFRNGAGVVAERNPWTAYQDLVGVGAASAPDAADRLVRRRQSVLDLVSGRLELLRSRRLSTADRTKLDKHFTAVRDLETKLQSAAPMCTLPDDSALRAYEGQSLYGSEHFPTVGRIHLDLIALAFTCGMNRVATMQVGKEAESATYNFDGMSHSQTHHGLSHGDDLQPMHEIDRWHASMLAELLQKLDDVVEDDGRTVLDNSVILWANSMTDGKRHNTFDWPAVLAGSGGGRLRQGEYIDMRGGSTRGIAHNAFLNTLINVCGVESAGFGNVAEGRSGIYESLLA